MGARKSKVGPVQRRMRNPGKEKRLTIADVAAAAEVSIGLVSSFLSGRDYANGGKSGIRIGRATAERIRQVCREMSYRPDRPAAFNRIYPELGEIALMSSFSGQEIRENPYHSLILDGVLAATTKSGSKLSIARYDSRTDYEADPEKLPPGVLHGEVNKFLLVGPPCLSFARSLVARGALVLYLSREIEVEGVAAVVPDYPQAAGTAVQYLTNLGHRRIGFVALSYFRGTYGARQLERGAREALTSLGLAWSPEDFQYIQPETPSMEAVLDRFLAQPQPPTAIFGFDDASTQAALVAAQRRNLRVPQDLSFVGCNDDRLSAGINPPLTTVHLPVHDLGLRGVETINQMALDGPEAVRSVQVLPVYLVERASSARR